MFQPFSLAEPKPNSNSQDIFKAARLTASRYIAYNKCHQNKQNQESGLDLQHDPGIITHASVINVDLMPEGTVEMPVSTANNNIQQIMVQTFDCHEDTSSQSRVIFQELSQPHIIVSPPAPSENINERILEKTNPKISEHIENKHSEYKQTEKVEKLEKYEEPLLEISEPEIDVKTTPMNTLVNTLKSEIDILNLFIDNIMEQLKDKEIKLEKSEKKYTDLKREYDYLLSKSEKENQNNLQRNCNIPVFFQYH